MIRIRMESRVKNRIHQSGHLFEERDSWNKRIYQGSSTDQPNSLRIIHVTCIPTCIHFSFLFYHETNSLLFTLTSTIFLLIVQYVLLTWIKNVISLLLHDTISFLNKSCSFQFNSFPSEAFIKHSHFFIFHPSK